MSQSVGGVVCLTSLLVMLLVSLVNGQLTIEFAEVDRGVFESLGPATITLNKLDENVGNLHLTITPLSFSDFSSMGFVLPPEIDIQDVDPAEDGDFSDAVQTVEFPANPTDASVTVSFQINDDDIHEADEGFLVVIQIDETLSDPQDVNNTVFMRNGVALINIKDDDPITLMFEQIAYTFDEDQGSFQNDVLIVKENGRESELDFTVILQASNGNAIEAEDYEVGGASLLFSAQDQTMPIIGEIIDDNIFELDHSFTLALGSVPGATYLVGPSVTVTIRDNEMAVIGFEQTGYTAGEGDGTVQVCVALLQPDGITIPQFLASIIQLSTSSMGSTAQENDDYTPLSGESVVINSLLNQRNCFDIQINDDSVAESTETIRVILTEIFLIERTTLNPTEATVSILDNDSNTVLPEEDCQSVIETLGNIITNRHYIVDNDALTVGFDQQALELEEGQRDEICVVLLQPDEIQFFLNLTISIDLQGSATEDQFDLGAARCISRNADKYDLTLSEEVTSCCFNVTTMDDDKLEESRVLMIKVEENSLSTPNSLLTLEPDVVIVTVTDNDGTPSSPTNLEAEFVNDDKDLLITWDADLTDPLRPIDQFLVKVNISSIPTTQETGQDSGVEMREFDTNDTQYTISDIDLDKLYAIVVCSVNTFGENCTDPLSPVTPGAFTTDSTDSGLEPGIIVLIVILAFLLALLCCILLIILLLCLMKDRLRSYYPEKREKKYEKERGEELKEVASGESDKV